MAKVFNVLQNYLVLLYYLLYVSCTQNIVSEPWIVSLQISSKNCENNVCKYSLNVRGGEFLGHLPWRLTPVGAPRGSGCEVLYPNYEIREIETVQWSTKLEVILPKNHDKVYFCLRQLTTNASAVHGKWVHQGVIVYLESNSSETTLKSNSTRFTDTTNENQLQQLQNSDWKDLTHDTDVNYLTTNLSLSQEKSNDIEVLIKDKYIPLNQINNNNTQTKPIKKSNDAKDLTVDDIAIFSKLLTLDSVKQSEALTNLVQSLYQVTFSELSKKDVSNRFKRAIFNVSTDINTIDNTIIKINLNDSDKESVDSLEPFSIRRERQVNSVSDLNTDNKLDAKESEMRVGNQMVKVEGLRVEESDKEPQTIEGGIPSVLSNSRLTIRLFGGGLTARTMIAFTHDPLEYGQPCKFIVKGEYLAKRDSITSNSALFDITAPASMHDSKLYICAKNLRMDSTDPFVDEEKYYHQGSEPFKILAIHNKLLPLWVTITLILVCLMFSALFSGLNLGLMSLDRTELKIISNTGTEQERKYARAIMPVRDHGNYLLCSILLGNVAVNSTFTILLDDLTSGLFAVIFSTLAIVLLGEITPQAICSRHGLMVGAKSIMVTKAVMALTAPLAYPISKLLDYFLGEEIGSVYNRERLKELVKVTTDVNDLDKDEVNIISGALELRKKTVCDVMTKLEDVFMLPISAVLDFETMSEIVKSGYSRIPVYEGGRGNIVTVLFIKDLAFVDPDDNTPLRTLCQYYQNPCNFVFEDVTLDIMFKQFKDGHKGHMAFVHRINNEGEGDPFYETIGLVTLEDVIEEMIQAEIVDETDVFLDNRSKRKRNRPMNKLQDFTAFAERHENQHIHISPQLTLATFQFLSTSVDAFRPELVSETVLRRLLRRDVVQHVKLKGKSTRDPSTYVFQQGKPVDYFALILEGRVEVTVGREALVFEAGPFTYFGVQALAQNLGLAESPTPSAMGSLQNITMETMLRHTFVPDYSVRAITELFYLTVKRSLYLAAKRATLMEKGALSKGATNEQFDTEVDKRDEVESLMAESSLNLVSWDSDTDLNGPSYSTVGTPGIRLLDDARATDGKTLKDDMNATTTSNESKTLSYTERLLERHFKKQKEENLDADAMPDSSAAGRELDATECDECVKNNFWTTSNVNSNLLQSVDEDISISGDHKTPSRQVSPNPPASFSAEVRSGDTFAARQDEQEKLLK